MKVRLSREEHEALCRLKKDELEATQTDDDVVEHRGDWKKGVEVQVSQ